jgi:exonuclease VII small subunit
MSAHRTTLAANLARIVSGLLSLALLGALLFTVVRGRGSIAEAEAAAEERAVRWASSALPDALTPEQASSEILGPAYRELLIVVQAGILADDRVARVRIWSPDGLLVFSSDQRDKIGEYVAEGDPNIETALAGEVVSVPTEATLGPKAGLAGADEKLLQTFVPLHLAGETGTSGVVQIDQWYRAIEDEAAGSWAGVRLALVAALTASVLWFLFTMRRQPTPTAVAVGARPAIEGEGSEDVVAALARAERAEAEVAAAGERLRALEARALAAEERAARAEADLAEVLADRPEAGVDEATAARLRELEEERRGLSAELARMRAALAEREAELTRAREGPPAAGVEAGADRIAELEAELERTRGEVERSRAELEAAVERAVAGEAERTELSSRVETTRAELETTRAELETTRAELETTRAELETTRAELETTRAELRTAMTDLDEARAQLSARVSAAAEEPAEDVEALRARIEELEAARRTDIAELQRAREALANTQYEAAQALRRAKELEGELAVLRAEAVEAPAAAGPEEEGRPTIGERLAALARERTSERRPPAEPMAAETEREAPAAEQPEEEGLSLRERLARAAAARHRAPGQDTERER